MKWMVLVAAFMAYMAVVHANRRCQTASDCYPNECCVTRHDSRPVGKCRRLGSQRSRCTTEPLSGDSNGGKYKRYCPCRDGLTCETPERYRQSTFLKREAKKRCTTSTATSTISSLTSTSEDTTQSSITVARLHLHDSSSRTISEATTPSSTSEVTTRSSRTTSDATAPNSRATSDATAPNSRVTSDATAPNSRATSDATSPNSRSTSDATAPNSRATSEAATPSSRRISEEKTPLSRITSEAITQLSSTVPSTNAI